MASVIRLIGYAAVLALVFGTAWAIGAATRAPAPAAASSDRGAAEAGHDHDGGSDAAAVDSAGLVATAAGYTFVPQVTAFAPGVPAEFAFSITGSDDRPVTAYDLRHDRQLHLIVVRRDAAGFQHLHPLLGPDGVWRVSLVLPASGVYRVYADFAPTGGPALVLGTDVFAPGEFVPVAFPAPVRSALVDGYQVRLDGELVPGTASQIFATISRNGAPITDLEPYLAAFGHLVALRQGDLAYLHVHPSSSAPAPTDRSGPGVPFTVDVPSAGMYRLFLDFQHAGVVRTAEFTVASRQGS